MAHVVVKIGKLAIETVITRQSAKEMKLKKGDKVEVVIKSTEVMLRKCDLGTTLIVPEHVHHDYEGQPQTCREVYPDSEL